MSSLELPALAGLKDFVELVEKRIPGGRWFVSIVLSLVLLVATVACVIYLKEHLLLPLFGLIRSAITGVQLRPTLDLRNINTLVNAIIAAGLTYVVYRLSKLVARVVKALEGLIENQETDVAHMGRMISVVDKLAGRIEALEDARGK